MDNETKEIVNQMLGEPETGEGVKMALEIKEAYLERADEIIIDLVRQFQKGDDIEKPYSAGLSALEGAFSYLIDRRLAKGNTLNIKFTKRKEYVNNKH
jgi:hypothetical protein